MPHIQVFLQQSGTVAVHYIILVCCPPTTAEVEFKHDCNFDAVFNVPLLPSVIRLDGKAIDENCLRTF